MESASPGPLESNRRFHRRLTAGPGSSPAEVNKTASRRAISSSLRPSIFATMAADFRARRSRKHPSHGGSARIRSSSDFRAIPAAKAASDSVIPQSRDSAQAGTRGDQTCVVATVGVSKSMCRSVDQVRGLRRRRLQNRTPRRNKMMSDNVALSFILLIIEKRPSSPTKTVKITLRNTQRRLTARRFPLMFPRPGRRPAPLPSCRGQRRRADASAGLDRSRPDLRRGGLVRQHASRLCLRLDAFYPLMPAPEPVSPAPGSASRRPLHHRLCQWHRLRPCSWKCRWHSGAQRETRQRLDHRAAAGRPRLELRATRDAARSQGSGDCHGDGRHPQQARRPAPAEGGNPARRPDRHAGNA